MAQRKSLKWTELKVGLLVLIGFAVLALAILRIGGPTSFFSKKMQITGYFPSANGLRPGAEVWLDGILVGNVDSVGINRDPAKKGRVAVAMSIDETYKGGIKSDSPISIDTIGLLGDKNIQLASGTDNGMPIEDGGEIYGEDVGDIRRIIQGTDDLVVNLGILSEKVISISDNLDQGKGTFGKFLTDPEIYNNLNDTVLNVQKLVEDIRTGPGTAGKLISDDEMYLQLTSMMSHMETMLAKLERGEGTAGKFMNDPAIYDRTVQLLDKFDSIASRVDRGEGSLGKMIRDDAIYNEIQATLAQVTSLVGAIQSGDGTAGKLIKDPTLFNSMDQAASEMQKLMYDIRQDPKKYLTINFRFF